VFEQGRTLTYGDCNAGFYGDFFGQYGYGGVPVRPLHNGGMNFVFSDGHAKWYNMTNHPGWDVPPNGYPPWGMDATWPQNQISFDVDYNP
jgi:prepilin-type processing-associated H-X9-DG protein